MYFYYELGFFSVASSMYWFRQSGSEVSFVTAAASNDGVVTVDGSGCVRVWETALSHLQRSIGKWRGLIGEGDTGHLQVRGQGC